MLRRREAGRWRVDGFPAPRDGLRPAMAVSSRPARDLVFAQVGQLGPPPPSGWIPPAVRSARCEPASRSVLSSGCPWRRSARSRRRAGRRHPPPRHREALAVATRWCRPGPASLDRLRRLVSGWCATRRGCWRRSPPHLRRYAWCREHHDLGRGQPGHPASVAAASRCAVRRSDHRWPRPGGRPPASGNSSARATIPRTPCSRRARHLRGRLDGSAPARRRTVPPPGAGPRPRPVLICRVAHVTPFMVLVTTRTARRGRGIARSRRGTPFRSP